MPSHVRRNARRATRHTRKTAAVILTSVLAGGLLSAVATETASAAAPTGEVFVSDLPWTNESNGY